MTESFLNRGTTFMYLSLIANFMEMSVSSWPVLCSFVQGNVFLVLGVLKAVKYVRGLLNILIAAMTFIT